MFTDLGIGVDSRPKSYSYPDTPSDAVPGETLAQAEKIVQERPTIGRDVVIIMIVACGLIGFYALFKAVSLLAGLPFP